MTNDQNKQNCVPKYFFWFLNLGADFLQNFLFDTFNFWDFIFQNYAQFLTTSTQSQFTKYNNFHWGYWYLAKNVSNFVSLTWKSTTHITTEGLLKQTRLRRLFVFKAMCKSLWLCTKAPLFGDDIRIY